jgi:hypothetical protein
MAAAAYRSGARRLRGAERGLADLLGEHEREHARRLAGAIEDLGGTPNRPRPAAEYAEGFPDLRDREAVLRFALDVENTAVAAYIDSLPKLFSANLRAEAAAIVTSEAQHLTVLREALGEETVPGAFVTGQ